MRIAMIGGRGLLSRYSGIETLLREICPRLVAQGHAVTVFGDDSDVVEFAGVSLESVPVLRTKHLETLSRSMIATLRTRSRQFDILHYHDVGAALFAPLGTWFGIPTVLTLHSLDWSRAKWSKLSRKAIRQIERIAVSKVEFNTVVSETLQQYLLNEYGIRSAFLPNVVETVPAVKRMPRSVDPRIEAQGYILFAARLTPEKAAHELIEAYRQLRSSIALVIAGDSRYDESYARLLRRAAEGLNVVFTGHVSGAELHALFRNARLFVLPSHVEGRSMALLEAIAHGTAVLVSDLPENLEVVGSRQCTFAKGRVRDLTAKLKRLMTNPDELQAIRDHVARLSQQQPTWKEVIKGYEDVYREAIRRHRGRQRAFGERK